MDTKTFWNEIGSKKDFTDPFFADQLVSFVSKEADIVEYGCGYGRILNLLRETGFKKLVGFEIAPNMVKRAKETYPDLDIRLLKQSAKMDTSDASYDAAILSTVLCSIPDLNEQNLVFKEIARVLRPEGYLYICDFLITDSDYYLPKYSEFAEKNSIEYGKYKTSNTFVRHHQLPNLIDRLKDFEIKWLIGRDSITMNGNPVKSFHLIARKR